MSKIYCVTTIKADDMKDTEGPSTTTSRMHIDLFVCMSWALPLLYPDREERSPAYGDIKIWDASTETGTYTRSSRGRTLVITKAKLNVTASF